MRRWIEGGLSVLLLAVTVYMIWVCGILWVFDLDGEGAVSAVAGGSGVILTLGALIGIITALTTRRWRPLWASLLVGGLVGALPWLALLG